MGPLSRCLLPRLATPDLGLMPKYCKQTLHAGRFHLGIDVSRPIDDGVLRELLLFLLRIHWFDKECFQLVARSVLRFAQVPHQLMSRACDRFPPIAKSCRTILYGNVESSNWIIVSQDSKFVKQTKLQPGVCFLPQAHLVVAWIWGSCELSLPSPQAVKALLQGQFRMGSQ